MLNLDTHVLLHAVTGDLTAREHRLLAASPWGISAIVLWEIATLAQLDRISVNLADPAILRVLAAVHIWPITVQIAHASASLDVHVDPADELIAATSIVQRIPLITRDRQLRRSRQIPLA